MVTMVRVTVTCWRLEFSFAQDPRSASRVALNYLKLLSILVTPTYPLFNLFRDSIVLLVSAASGSLPTPGRALSPEVLKTFHSASIFLHPSPSVCLLSPSSLTSLPSASLAFLRWVRRKVGSVPSLPAPLFSPSLSRASANPVFASAALNLKSMI